jgi:citrate synthase
MASNAILSVAGTEYELPVFEGSEDEKAIDISKLRAESACITMDSGYGNTGSCFSDITFIDGEKGILQYRGYPIAELAGKCSFLEVAYLILHGELPNYQELTAFKDSMAGEAGLHTSLTNTYNGFPPDAPPMAILSAMLNVVACHNPAVLEVAADGKGFDHIVSILLSKVPTIAAYAYRMANGKVFNPPNPNLDYAANFLHMMFSEPYVEYEVLPEVEDALNLFLLLHADHEQNCSTSTVRMVGSTRANLFSSVSAGVCALWGPLHGGANVAVMVMLDEINESGKSLDHYIERAKDKNDPYKLMGFGHRVYRNFDPRSLIIKKHVHIVLDALGIDDNLLNIALDLEDKILNDDYFVQRKLYPNVDFYSGILLKAIGIPRNMYTVLFAMGRMPGWIANWRELLDHNQRIARPRQVYTGKTKRAVPNMDERE